jgi:hypothetical protein
MRIAAAAGWRSRHSTSSTRFVAAAMYPQGAFAGNSKAVRVKKLRVVKISGSDPLLSFTITYERAENTRKRP